MARSCCSCLVGLKMFVWMVNFLVFLFGLVVTLLATSFIFNYKGVLYFETIKAVMEANENLLEPWITNWHVTCFAVLAIILGFVGCCGAAKEASAMLCCYMLMQAFITISLMAAAVCGYIFYDRIFDRLLTTMDEFDRHNQTALWSERWNLIQTGGECCGIQSELDWKETAAFNGTGLKPLSCCPNIDDPNLCKLYAPDSYTLGCTDTWLHYAEYPLIALSIFQILAIISSGALRRQIRREKYYY